MSDEEYDNMEEWAVEKEYDINSFEKENEEEETLAILNNMRNKETSDSYNKEWGKDHQLFKFMVRYSNSDIQDKDTWINEIQPEFDILCRKLCKTFSYQIEDSRLDQDDELEQLLQENDNPITPDLEDNNIMCEDIQEEEDNTDELEICKGGFTESELESGALEETIKNNPFFDELETDDINEDNEECIRNIHIQGQWTLKTRRRASTLCRALNSTFWAGIEIKPQISHALIDYTQKKDTRVAGPWTELGKKYQGEDVLERPMWVWQQQLYDLFTKSDPVSRAIYYIYDKKGNNGKSDFIKRWRFLHPEIFGCISDASTISQLTSTLCNKIGPKKVYMYDASRAKKTIENWRLIYTVFEALSGGYVQSNLYGSVGKNVKNELLCSPPHICIFANTPFKKAELSNDRFRCYEIVSDPENPGREFNRLKPYKDKSGKEWAPEIEDLLENLISSSDEEFDDEYPHEEYHGVNPEDCDYEDVEEVKKIKVNNDKEVEVSNDKEVKVS